MGKALVRLRIQGQDSISSYTAVRSNTASLPQNILGKLRSLAISYFDMVDRYALSYFVDTWSSPSCL